MELQDQLGGHPSRALLAIHERVMVRDAPSVGRGQVRRIGLAVRGLLPGARHGRLEQAEVSNAGRTTLFSNLFAVHRPQHSCFDPDPPDPAPAGSPGQRASSRSALRRFFITRRAAAICCSISVL
jgi:hypothetical protein